MSFFAQICCPRRPITKKIDVPDCTDEDYDEYGLKPGVYCEYRDEAEFETFQYKSAEECKQNSTCTIKSQCGLKGMYEFTLCCILICMCSMAIRVDEFSFGVYKIGKIFA